MTEARVDQERTILHLSIESARKFAVERSLCGRCSAHLVLFLVISYPTFCEPAGDRHDSGNRADLEEPITHIWSNPKIQSGAIVGSGRAASLESQGPS
jgi:hypothetical protein